MKRKQPKKILKKIAKFHAIFSLGLFILYLALSLIYGPEFLLSDMRHKFRALADEWVYSEETMLAIFASVLGPPVKPIVTGEVVCSDGNLSINLDWSDDENSETFDITRNGLPLVSDLAASQYADAAGLVVNTDYTYVVTARGPMGPGNADSDPVTITTSEECGVVLPVAIVQIVSFNGKNVTSYTGIPATTNRRPVFSGTSNIPNALIHLSIHSEVVVYAQIIVNGNGYWSWRPPINLPVGTHSRLIAEIDPLGVLETINAEFTFIIEEEDEEEDEKKKEETMLIAPSIQPQPPAPVSKITEIPLEFSLKVMPPEVFQGKEIGMLIRIERVDSQYAGREAIVRYRIFNAEGEQRENILGDITLRSGVAINRNIPIPTYFNDGLYRIQVEIIFDKYSVSQEKSFSVLPLPILKLGGGFTITYPELLSRLGTASLWLLLCLIIWLLFFSREYWLYLHALRHITERNLEKTGLFGIRKGKGVSR